MAKIEGITALSRFKQALTKKLFVTMDNAKEFVKELLLPRLEDSTLDDVDVYQCDFDFNFTSVAALIMFKKHALNPYDLELYSEQQVVKVLQDLGRLKSFVEQVSADKCAHSPEATRLLNSLHNETI